MQIAMNSSGPTTMPYNRIGYQNQLGYKTLHFLDHFFGRQRVDGSFGNSRKRLFHHIDQRISQAPRPELVPVERRKDMTPYEFRKNYLRKRIPVILEAAAKNWPCCKTWDFDYFDQRHGADEVILLDRSGKGTNELNAEYETSTFHQIIQEIRSGGNKYLNFYPILQRHPEHYADFDMGWLKRLRHRHTIFRSCELFMGGANTESTMHNANQANLFVQVLGEKKWILYPVSQTPIIDPDPVRNLYRNAPFRDGPPFNSFEPDYDLYPRAKHLQGYEVHLRPGDILYNPPFMWHSVKNITDSIGCSYRWINPFHSFFSAPLYFLLDLCSTNPPFFRSLKLSAKDFNLVRLAEQGLLEDYLGKKRRSPKRQSS